jgi:hypothetical protein
LTLQFIGAAVPVLLRLYMRHGILSRAGGGFDGTDESTPRFLLRELEHRVTEK